MPQLRRRVSAAAAAAAAAGLAYCCHSRAASALHAVLQCNFYCCFRTANTFLKMLAAETSGRYHRCHGDFDAERFAHKLLTEGFDDPEVRESIGAVVEG